MSLQEGTITSLAHIHMGKGRGGGGGSVGGRGGASVCEDALFQGGRDNEAGGREIAQKAVTDLKQIIREHI